MADRVRSLRSPSVLCNIQKPDRENSSSRRTKVTGRIMLKACYRIIVHQKELAKCLVVYIEEQLMIKLNMIIEIMQSSAYL
jgi:hypothetical protein